MHTCVLAAACAALLGSTADDPGKAVIDGIVVTESGAPAADVAVSTSQGRLPDAATTSAADGRFRLVLDGPTASYRAVVARSADGSRLAFGRTAAVQFERAATLRLTLKPAVAVRAWVVDGRGAPVAGALVAADGHDGPLDPTFHALTDAVGRATLHLPADVAVARVVALKPGAGLDYYENYRSTTAPDRFPPPAEVRLTLDGALTARLRVADADGRPLSGVEIFPILLWKKGKLNLANPVQSSDRLGAVGRVVTDAQGVAVCDWLPAALERSVPLQCVAPGYRCEAVPYADLAARVEPETTRLSRLVTVGGRVTRPDGAPAAGVLVQADNPRRGGAFARTGADGRYRMEVIPGTGYLLTVIDPEFATAGRSGVDVQAGVPRADLDLALIVGTLIEGQVTAAGRPAAEQRVYLKQLGPAPPAAPAQGAGDGRPWLLRGTATDAEGRYRFRVGPGDYQLAGPDMMFTDLATAAEPAVTRDLRLPRLLSGPFAGTVRTPAGAPAAGALVQGVLMGEARTDAQGQFQATRGRQPMLLYAHDAAGALAGYRTVGADDESTELTLKPAATAAGRVVGRDGQPRAGCYVHLLLRDSADKEPSRYVRISTASGPDGTFTVAGLAAGTACDVVICDGIRCGSGAAKTVTVTEPTLIALGDLVAPGEGK